MDEYIVKFRYGTPVTTTAPFQPELMPGAFTFDAATLALYIDTSSTRVQVKDPLKLSLTGGTLTGDLEVSSNGSTTSCIRADTGVIRGMYLETTGNIHLDERPTAYAVIDANGRVRTRTRAEMLQDLNIIDPATLGALAYKDLARGSYTPQGSISTPTATVNSTDGQVITDFVPGQLPSFTVSGEKLTLSEGTQPTVTKSRAVLKIDSISISKPEFTGIQATITVS